MKKTLLLLSFLFISVAGFCQSAPSPYRYDSVNPTGNDGYFLRNNVNQQIFLVMEGRIRYIQTPATLNGLFVGAAANLIDVSPAIINSYPVGTAISSASGFRRLISTQQVFLIENTTLRLVQSIGVANLYHFNLSIAVNISSLSGYTVGAPITL